LRGALKARGGGGGGGGGGCGLTGVPARGNGIAAADLGARVRPPLYAPRAETVGFENGIRSGPSEKKKTPAVRRSAQQKTKGAEPKTKKKTAIRRGDE